MDMENSSIKMECTIKVTLRMIAFMGEGLFIMQQIAPPIQEIG
jgi:hypothetical protein